MVRAHADDLNVLRPLPAGRHVGAEASVPALLLKPALHGESGRDETRASRLSLETRLLPVRSSLSLKTRRCGPTNSEASPKMSRSAPLGRGSAGVAVLRLASFVSHEMRQCKPLMHRSSIFWGPTADPAQVGLSPSVTFRHFPATGRPPLPKMPRRRLTLADLVKGGTFDPGNFRHRRALDESGHSTTRSWRGYAGSPSRFGATVGRPRFEPPRRLQDFALAVAARKRL
jgi:hypothetical protein